MASRAELLEKLAAIRRAYAESLPAKIQECRELFDRISTQWDAASAREIQSQIHRLAGSGGTFGFKVVTTTARAIERVLDRIADEERTPGAAELSELETLLSALAAAATEQDGEGPQLPGKRTTPRPGLLRLPECHVLLLCDDPDRHAGWIEELKAFGFHVACLQDQQTFKDRVALQTPRAVVLDLDGGWLGVDAEQMRSIERNAGRRVPMVVVSASADLQTRLRAVRLGGRHFLNLPLDVAQLADLLCATDSELNDPVRIVIVEDDPITAEQYAATFENAGMRSTLVHCPEDLIPTLVEVHPDVLVMNLSLADVSGLELAGVIRQHDAFAALPIVFLAVDGNRDTRLAALELGDDFLTRPIDGVQLVSQVAARAQRARSRRASLDRDGLTGLLQPTSFFERLQREVLWATRQGSDFALVLLDLDGLRGLNASYGHLVGDRALVALARLLKQRFRRTDSVGRCGPTHFGVLVMQADAATCRELVDRLRQRLAEQPLLVGEEALKLSLSAGVAIFSRYCEADALVEAAENALRSSQRAGGNQVTLAG